MTRARVVVLVVAAAAASGAMSATAAHAGEVGVCARAAKVKKHFTGRYLDKQCAIAASAEQRAAGKKNKWEWKSAAGAKYTGQIAGSFRSGASASFCRGTVEGEFTGWQTGRDVLTFSCWEIGGFRCTSTGQSYGTVVFTQATYLIDHGMKGPDGGEPAEGEVWQEYQSPEGLDGLQSFGDCYILGYRVTGSLTGRVAFTGSSSHRFEVSFGNAGEQPIEQEYEVGGGGDWNLLPTHFEGDIDVRGTKVEVRACNAGACEHEEPPPW